jgi:serine/threonine protein phosphatase 1
MNKIFAIGDIHGCLDKLRSLMQKIDADPAGDTLVFIGDYIDRAAGGRDVVDYVLTLKKQHSKVICLCGNHESMLLRYLEGIDEEIYLQNGGLATLNAYGISKSDSPRKRKAKVPADHLRFYESLLLYYETDDFIFVHAGLEPGVPLSQQDTHDLLWVRQEFIASDYDFGKRVIFGHTHLQEPLIMPNKIGIDTGAVYGGKLSCLELPALIFHSV